MFSGTISGSGSAAHIGQGTLILTGSNSYNGGTTIGPGSTLQIDDPINATGTNGWIVGNVLDKGTLAFSRIDNVTFPGNISGSGALVRLGDQNGGGLLVLTGSTTYSGGTTVSSGTLQVGNGALTGSITGNTTLDDSNYYPVLAFSRSNNISIQRGDHGLLWHGNAGPMGPGKLTLTGSSNYGSNNTLANGGNGGTQVSGGTLQIGNGGNTGSITNDVYLSNNGVLVFNRSDNIIFGGVIMDDATGNLVQMGPGKLTLTANNNYGSNDGYNGCFGTVVSGGTLQIGNGGSTGSITGDGSVGNPIMGDVCLTTSGVLAFSRSDNIVFGGTTTDDGTGALVQLGPGKLTLTGVNTHAAGTTISGGTLQIDDGSGSGSIVGNVLANSGTLIFNRPDVPFIFAGVISGTGRLCNGAETTTAI